MPFQFSEGMPSSLFRKPQTWVNWRWTSLSQTQFTLKFKSFLVQEIPLPFSTIFFLEFGPSQTISILSKDQIQWGLKFNYKLRYFPWINIYTAWLSSGSFLPVSCYTCVAGEADRRSQPADAMCFLRNHGKWLKVEFSISFHLLLHNETSLILFWNCLAQSQAMLIEIMQNNRDFTVNWPEKIGAGEIFRPSPS